MKKNCLSRILISVLILLLLFPSALVSVAGLSEETENRYAVDGQVRDTADVSVIKEDEDEEQNEAGNGNEKETALASVVGEGNLLAIAVMLAAAVFLTAAFVLLTKRKKKEENPKK